ncbi:hypothetical protein D9M71_790210 [compost metagenome]
MPLDAGGLVLALAGEGVGFGLLVAGEQVNGELLALVQHRVGVGTIVGAEQHQRRVDRQGAEGAGGDTDDVALGVERGDHGHAGWE